MQIVEGPGVILNFDIQIRITYPTKSLICFFPNFDTYIMDLRFEFHVPQQILQITLATNEKLPLKSLSYLLPKLGNQLTKNANFLLSKSFFKVKNQPNLSKLFFLTNFKLGDQLLLMKCFIKKMKNTLFSKNVSIFCQLISEFW